MSSRCVRCSSILPADNEGRVRIAIVYGFPVGTAWTFDRIWWTLALCKRCHTQLSGWLADPPDTPLAEAVAVRTELAAAASERVGRAELPAAAPPPWAGIPRSARIANGVGAE